jgi:hypothetical protein
VPATLRTRVLAGVIAALAAAHLAVVVFDQLVGAPDGLFVRLDLNSEQSFGTFFSVGMLAATALATAALARTARTRDLRRGWWALAALLALLSVDEEVGMHEWFGTVISARVEGLPPVLAFPWTLPALLALSAFAFWQRRFLAGLPPGLGRRLLVATAVLVVGAIGLEVPESVLFSGTGSERTLPFLLLVGAEETLEMAGVLLFLRAVLCELADQAPAWRIDLDRRGAEPRLRVQPGDGEAVHPWFADFATRDALSPWPGDDALATSSRSRAPERS